MFSNNRTAVPINNKFNMETVMGFSKKYIQMRNQKNMQLNVKVEPEPPPPPKPTMVWGEPIWTLFHTLAEKVSEESFVIVGKDLIDVIIKICSNLPCPNCTEHAKDYINKNKFINVNSRESLRNFLFDFHNSVNKRRGVALFEKDQLEERYSNKEIVLVIKNFMNAFKDKHFSIRMIANDFHRNRTVNSLSVWFNSNIQYFI
jgi:hypothetical protein